MVSNTQKLLVCSLLMLVSIVAGGCSGEPSPSGPNEADASLDASGDTGVDADSRDAADVAPDVVEHDAGDVDGVSDDAGSCAPVAAFDGAIELAEGSTRSDTGEATGSSIGASCAGGENLAAEDVYTFTLAEKMLARIAVEPTWSSRLDPVVTLHEKCDASSEMVCFNERVERQGEQVSRVLDVGTYYVVVQGGGADNTGDYTLDFALDPVVCTPGEASCEDASTSSVCNVWGTESAEIGCDVGCDETSGLCQVAPGDACYAAIEATGGYTGTIDWSLHTNDYDPESGGCVPNNQLSMATDGPDVAYRIELAAGEALRADLETIDDYGSLYLVRDCQELGQSCVVGNNEAVFRDADGVYREQLTYFNNTGVSQTLFVVADTGELTVAGLASIAIEQGEPACVPGNTQCAGDVLERCDPVGLAFQTERACVFGCDSGANSTPASCTPPTNQICKGAVDLGAIGGSYTGRIDDYSGDFDPGVDGCTASSTPGPDAVFSIDAQEGEIVTVTMEADFDASLWVTRDCSSAGRACVAGSAVAGQKFESLQFAATHAGTYYIIADSTQSASGEFTVQAQVSAAMSCTPGDVLGCSTTDRLSYCSSHGVPVEYPCRTSCSVGGCDSHGGDICHDAIPLVSGDAVSGSIRGSNAVNPGGGVQGACDFGTGSAIGPDTVYSVDLQLGDILDVSLSAFNAGLSVYLLEDCGDAASCQAMMNGSGGIAPEWFRYRADSAGTVYIVVDYAWRVPQASDDTSYNITVDVTSPVCTPGVASCSQNGGSLEVCNDDGVVDSFACSGGCSNGACAEPAGEVCADAMPLQSGDVVEDTLDGVDTLRPRAGSVGACYFARAPYGREKIYRISLAQGEMLSAQMLTSASSSMMYLMSDCTQPDTCLAATPRGTAVELDYTASQDETVFLVVDRTADTADDFRLSVSTQFPGCVPGEVACMSDGKTLGRCDSEGVFETVVCETGCTNAACDAPVGDVCFDAVPLATGDSVTGHFGGTDQLDLGTTDLGTTAPGACASGGQGVPGNDTIYSVDVTAGQILEARLTTQDDEAVMYVLEDCDQTSSCVAAETSGLLRYQALEDGQVFLVVDRTNGNWNPSTTYTLDVLVQTPSCTPGVASCADGQTLEYCDGLGLLRQYTCFDEATQTTSTCASGACSTPAGDFCADATPLVDGDSVTGSFDGINTVNPPAGFVGGCWFGKDGPVGSDRVFSVELQAGEVLEVVASSTLGDAVVYLLEDCLDTTSCLDTTARLDKDRGPGTTTLDPTTTLFYEAASAETVYVVVDSLLAAQMPSETFDIQVDISTPSCTPGSTRCMADGQTLETCNGFGVWQEYLCQDPTDGQPQSCTNGACSPQMGDVCADAIVLQSGDTVYGRWEGTRAIDPPDASVGGCDFDPSRNEGLGLDTIYAVDLQAGELLTARVEADVTNYSMYLLEDCHDTHSCLANVPLGAGNRVLRHQAANDGRVYVVLDQTFALADGEVFELSIDVQTPGCAPGVARCAQNGTDLEVCNDLGVFDSVSCSGGCAQGSCAQPEGDVCFDAITLTSGDSVTGDWDGTNSARLSTQSPGACDFGAHETPGTDTFYRIDLQTGEVLSANLSSSLDDARMYLLDGCASPQSASCLANTAAGRSLELNYEASSSGPVYLVVDAQSGGDTLNSYTLDVDVQTPSCVVGETRCDATGAVLETCNEYNVYESFSCNGSCTAGRCDNPTGEFCQDAVLLGDGEEFAGSFADYTNDLDPGYGTCVIDTQQTQDGPDAVFAVDLNAGQALEATLYAEDRQAGLYLLDGCTGDEASRCVHGKTAQSQLSFYADESKTYYLVVDSTAAFSSGEFVLSVDIHASHICQPGGSTCDAATETLTTCSDDGTATAAVATCAYGCDTNTCAAPTAPNDLCAQAEVITESTRIRDNFARFSNQHNPPEGICSTFSPIGPDAVYSIALDAGESVVASVSGSKGPMIYFLERCSDDSQCLSSAESKKGGRAAYTATVDQTVFLVVDTMRAGTDAIFELDIDISSAGCQPDPNHSNYSQPTCLDAQTRQSCSERGRWRTETCAFGCQSGACAPPSNDSCSTATEVIGSTSTSASFASYTPKLDPADAWPSCTGNSAVGPEAVYFVDALKNEVIRASVRSLDDVAVWITRDCASAALSCAAGSDESDALPEMLEYVVPEDGRYYIVADSYWPDATAEFSVDIAVEAPTCQAGVASCADSTTLRYCTSDGAQKRDYVCSGGCSNGACAQPTGDVCPDAVSVSLSPVSSTTVSGDFATLTDQFDPGFGGCTGYEAAGADAAYAVDLSAGDTMTATLRNAGGSQDLSLYIVQDCTDTKSSCLVGADAYGEGDETVTYTATGDETVYLIADSYTAYDPADGSGAYELEIVIQ